MKYPDIEEAKKLVAGIWGKQLEQIAIDCSAPLFWVENPKLDNQIIHNGTIFFLNTGTNRFAVSAFHVYKGYLESLSAATNTICQIYHEKFNPSDHIIDYSEDLDLITFNIDEKLVKKINKKYLFGYQSNWPPEPPQIEKGLVFAGYPGIERKFDDPFTINWGVFRGICVANSIGEENISIHFDQNFAIDRPDKIPQGYNPAGISGAPLITLVESEVGINYWRLGGVIIEAQPKWDVMLAKRVDFITADGKINQNGKR